MPTILWPSLFFGLGTVVLVHEAVIRVRGAAVLFWILSILCALYALAGLLPVIWWITPSFPTLELGPESVVLPSGLLHRRRKTIHYNDIRAILEQKNHGQTVLFIHGTSEFGKVVASLLPDADSYIAVKRALFDEANLTQK
jgi:hypothetical protein